MYVSKLNFRTMPGKSQELEEMLGTLVEMVASAGGSSPRVLRTHFASPGAPDVVFEQEAEDLAALERQIGKVTGLKKFQEWSGKVSPLLAQSPHREIFSIRS
jgi:hypothetical protein